MTSSSSLICCPSETRLHRICASISTGQTVLTTTELSSVLTLLTENDVNHLIIDQSAGTSEKEVAAAHDLRSRLITFLKKHNLNTQVWELVSVDEARPAVEVTAFDRYVAYERLEDLVSAYLAKLAESVDVTTSRPSESVELPPDSSRLTPVSDAEMEVFDGNIPLVETRSPQFRKMLTDLEIAGGHDVAILLIGETGSGKTHLSRMVHARSPRNDQPFLHVACGALPRDLIEGELFGHAKGAFTSAHADKEGKFLAARRGTILLDEIDVLGPDQQVKLLRVIETGEFEPVGSNRTHVSEARLIFASNLDLEPLVEQGKFRPDLYYRLNMMKFEIPPLRKRKMDIIPLSRLFIQKFRSKHGIPVSKIDDAVLDALLGYPWPGNVRELEHVMQRAVIYCRDGVLKPEHLPPHLLNGQVGPTNDPSIRLGTTKPAADENSLGQQVAVSEKEIIEQTLYKNNYSRTNTAKELGISRVTLYNKMKKYEMLKPSQSNN